MQPPVQCLDAYIPNDNFCLSTIAYIYRDRHILARGTRFFNEKKRVSYGFSCVFFILYIIEEYFEVLRSAAKTKSSGCVKMRDRICQSAP